MSQWFVIRNGEECGPFHTDELLALLDRGVIPKNSRVRKDGNPFYLSCEEIPDLNGLQKKTVEAVPEKALPEVPARYDVISDLLRFSCPECGQHYTADPAARDHVTLHCANCEAAFILRTPPTAPAAQAAAAPEAATASAPAAPDPSGIIGDLVCPHCWNTFSAGDILYISAHPDLLGDPIAGPMEQKRFVPVSYDPQGLPLDEKGMVCSDMACPHCHLALPGSILDWDSRYISIVGAPSCGKSYYLTALVHQLRKALPEYADESFADADPRINRTINDYENRMFMANDLSKVVTLLKTEQIGKDFSDQTFLNGLPIHLPKPFIFQCEALVRSGKPGTMNAFNLIFYDNAGEHFQPGNESVSNPATLHLAHSDAIFFLFDPLNDPGMRRICDTDDPQLRDESKISNQTILFSEMVSRIRRHANMTMEEKSPIPLIIVLGKYDACESRFPWKLRELPPFSFNAEKLENEFDADLVYSVSFSLRELMLEYAPGIVAQAEAFFETVLFVPVSTFGAPAVCDEKLSSDGRRAVGVNPMRLAPVWVEVPFFAVLDHFGLLPRRTPDKDSEVLKACGGAEKLTFAHPLTGRKVQLPPHYAGHTLSFNGRKMRIEKIAGEKNGGSANAADLWK